MTAVKTSEADRFIVKPPSDVFVFLVFGSDTGLVSERLRKLVAATVDDPKDPFQLVRLEADALAKEPSRLLDEVQTVPLFGGRRAVLIDAGGKNIAAAVELALASDSRDCTVIIEGGALKKDAPLRKLLERVRNGAAIECFPDEARDVARLVEDEARAAGLALDGAAKEALIHLLGADRLTTRSELAKLITYAHGTGRITLDDVEAVVANASATVQDTAVDGALLGDVGAIEATLARLFAEGGDASVLLGAALRHAMLLHRSRIEADAGRSIADIVEGAARFGLFFRRKAAFERQLHGWNPAKLARAIEILSEAVAKCRRQPQLGEAIAARALWTIALASPSRSGRAQP